MQPEITVDPDEVVAICRDLVRAGGENPPGNEEAVARVTEKWLAEIGLTTTRVEAEPGRPNVVAEWGRGGGKTLLFNGHYDVVPATNLDKWPYPPFEGVVHEGKLHGRGSCDMKAGIAACIAAVAALKRGGFEPAGRIVMHFVADEEVLGALGTKYLLESGYCQGVTEAIVGEPTALNLVTSERGALWASIVTQGVSAHGATPHLGVNAIAHMSYVVQAISKMRFKKLHETLGAPTVNIGTIKGGAKVNSVADSCTIEIDRRTLPGETAEEVIAEIQAVLDETSLWVDGLKAKIESHLWATACQTPPDTRVVALLAEAAASFGHHPDEFGYGGATDARFLNEAGIPSVIFGPGDLLKAHTTGEYVDIDQLVLGARIYAHTFTSFLS